MRDVVERVLGGDPDERRLGSGLVARVGVGVVLVVAGLISFVGLNDSFGTARQVLIAFVVVLLGVGLLAGPWIWRLASDLVAERRELIRSEQRAEMAAHLHDSVLQTLTLIQRHPERADEVARLARIQERELRAWLDDPSGRRIQGTLASALRVVADDVEDGADVTVECVFVGDRQLDESVAEVIAAAGEALRNAASHSGEDVLSLYCEVGERELDVYVRDRGIGFETDSVGIDRRGITHSIVGRMERIGGGASIRSTPGEGTEIWLHLPIDESEPLGEVE
jgi:signal transduction histidine kinase